MIDSASHSGNAYFLPTAQIDCSTWFEASVVARKREDMKHIINGLIERQKVKGVGAATISTDTRGMFFASLCLT